ncbi:MAG: hypothetical protein KDB88_12100, partial [Flavobacteriales bacterium]|nr:hypothetical protein [Flavobacteriales bacterium]
MSKVSFRSISAVALLFTSLAQGQDSSFVDAPVKPVRSKLLVEGTYLQDASTLYNDLLQGLTSGGFIDREVRQRSADALDDLNRAGQEISLRTTFISGDSLFGQAGLQWLVSAAHKDLLGVRFGRDVYTLTFFGNAPFEGEQADLGGSAFEHQIFQSLGGGLHWAKTGSWVRLDVLKGQLLDAINLKDATLFTAVDGRSLDGTVRGDLYRSDPERTGFGAFNGWGLALSFSRTAVLKSLSKRSVHRFTARVDDLGFIRWG